MKQKMCNNFENLSAFGKHIDKSLQLTFLTHAFRIKRVYDRMNASKRLDASKRRVDLLCSIINALFCYKANTNFSVVSGKYNKF